MSGIDPVELIWIAFILGGAVFVVAALFDARADRDAVRRSNGKVRTIQTRGNVRREWLKLAKLGVMLGAVIPLLPVVRPNVVSPTVLLLMAVPLLILIASALDAKDRRELGRISDAAIEAERASVESKVDALAEQITVGTEDATAAALAGAEAATRAEAAVAESTARVAEAFGNATANNLKIADQAQLISTLQPAIKETRELTGEVHDAIIHPKDVP